MIILHRLEAENFLSLQRVNVELRDLNVLVGPNGSGKSNLLRVIGFLGDTARMDLGPAIEAHGGMAQLRFRGETGRSTRSVRLKVEAHVTPHASDTAPDEYSLTFWRQGRTLQRREEFKFKRLKGRGRRITLTGHKAEIHNDAALQAQAPSRSISLRPDSAGLSTLQRLSEKDGAPQVRQFASLFERFRVFDPDVSKARRPASSLDSGTLAADASNLAAFLVYLKREAPDTFHLLLQDLRTIVPSVKDLHFETLGGPTSAVKLSLEEHALAGRTDLAHASFGTIRALAVLAMLHDPHPPPLTCMEEIDHGLHPYALDVVVDRLRTASEKTQLILATHSPALVNRLNYDELIVCERDDETGASRIPAIDPEDIKEIARDDELALGELWFSGVLGGIL